MRSSSLRCLSFLRILGASITFEKSLTSSTRSGIRVFSLKFSGCDQFSFSFSPFAFSFSIFFLIFLFFLFFFFVFCFLFFFKVIFFFIFFERACVRFDDGNSLGRRFMNVGAYSFLIYQLLSQFCESWKAFEQLAKNQASD